MNPNQDTPILGRFGRRVSDATKYLVTGEVPQTKERSSSTSRSSPSTGFPSCRPSGKPRRFISNITHCSIVESSAPSKYFIEADHCTHDVVTCDVRLRETSESARACLDTASSTSFISTYEARTKFHSSEIRTLSSPIEFGTGGGRMIAREYVVADLYLPIATAMSSLAKATAVLFLREGRLPNGSEILLGMDFLMAQRMSILLPNRTAIIGRCGNAEIRIMCFKNEDYPVRQNTPNLAPSGRPPQPQKDVSDLIAESRKNFQGPPVTHTHPTRGPPAGRPQHQFGEKNFFMITSPENNVKSSSLMSGNSFGNSNNARSAGAPGKISAPVSAPHDSAFINGQPHPLRSAPAPGLTKDPATAFSSHAFVPGYSAPQVTSTEPPASPVGHRDISTDISSISQPVPQPRPFTISDKAVLRRPRPTPDVPSKYPVVSRNGTYLGKIFRPGRFSPSGPSSSSYSSSSVDSNSTVRLSNPSDVSGSAHPQRLNGLTINPNTRPDADVATKIACDAEFSSTKF